MTEPSRACLGQEDVLRFNVDMKWPGDGSECTATE